MTDDVSIIVVSYNTREMTAFSVGSVLAETAISSYELVVLDNASTDCSADEIAGRFPEVRVIASSKNLGFAAGNNVAAREAEGEYLLLLNPDTVVLDGAIDKLVAFAEAHPDAGIYGGRTVFADGSLNPSSVWAKPTVWNAFCRAVGLSAVMKRSPLFNGDSYGGWDRDTVREVDIVSGCFLLIRRELWDKLGGFDTSYFMYGEDWDLCLRAKALGYRCLFCPEAEIVHYGGASEKVRADKLVRLFETKCRLYRQHWGPLQARILIALLKVWVIRSWATNAVANVFTKRRRVDEAKAWRDVWVRREEWAAVKNSGPE